MVKEKGNNGIKASSLKHFLLNSYAKINKQSPEIDGYQRDDSLSGRRHQVYYNPSTGKAIISHRGTEGTLKDWSNNLAYATGLYHHTDRYHVARDAQNKAEGKYGSQNVTTIGHSQGSMLAGDVGKNSKQIIAVDRPAKLSELLFKTTPKNHYDVRTSKDLVSSMIPFQKSSNKITTIKSKTFNPIVEHDLNRLDELGDEIVGGNISFESMDWGSLKKRLVSYNNKYHTNMDLLSFSHFILQPKSGFHKKTKLQARFYLNVLQNHK